MDIKTIPLSRLETDLCQALCDCADTGSTLVVELPGDRFVTIQSLDPSEDDDLVGEFIETDSAFREMIERSKSSPRKPFDVGAVTE